MKKLLCATAILASTSVLAGTPTAHAVSTDQQLKNLEQQSQELQHEISMLQEHAPKTHESQPISHVFTGGSSPFINHKTAYNASDVLQQYSSMNEQIILLKNQQTLIKNLAKNGQTLSRPYLQISGGIEAQLYYNDEDLNANSRDQGINLATGEFDMDAAVSQWANGYLSFSYDNTPTNQGNRQPKRQVYLQRGFLTLGDLQKSPFYVSIGQMYVPFGSYSSALISTPLTESVGRILSATAIVGYTSHGINISAFGYSGSMTSEGNAIIKQGGGDISFNHAFGANNDIQMRASYVSNIADSQGMQSNGLDKTGTFEGFASDNYNDLKHRVDAGDINALIKFNNFTLLGEYLMPFTPFASQDLTFNGKGADPKAMHVEAQYNIHVKNQDVTFALAYGHTWQALGLNLPESSYAAVLSTSFFKNTITSLEYRHDTDYSASDSAHHGAKLPATDNNGKGSGKTRNSVILQTGVYF